MTITRRLEGIDMLQWAENAILPTCPLSLEPTTTILPYRRYKFTK